MREYEYKINEERKIILTYFEDNIEIQDIINKTDLYKDYRIVYSDDYGFSGYTENYELDELVFNIDIDHPLYYPFLHFLNNDKEIKIASDFKKEEYDNICYVKIAKEKEIITLSFVNYIKEEHNDCEKFNYEIKNIMFDLRSKLDEQKTNIKERLWLFFNESIQRLTEEYHQITIEEHMDNLTRMLTK